MSLAYGTQIIAEVDDGLQRALIRLAEVTGKKLGAVVKQNTRLIAWNLAHNTQPYGMNLAAKKTGETAVARDVGNVYKSATVIFDLLKIENENLAKGWYRRVKAGAYGEAERMLREYTELRDRNAAIFEPLDPDFHREARNRRGRVSRHRAAQILPDGKHIKAYIKQRQQLVGFAKAGWITAGSQLGSITRVPAWITRHKGTAPGYAEDRTKNTTDPYAVITNDVRYVSKVIDEQQFIRALRMQEDKMLAHIEHVLVNTAREAGFTATTDAPSEPLPLAA